MLELEQVALGSNASQSNCLMNKEVLNLVGIVVAIIFELVGIKLVVKFLRREDDNVT